MKTNYYLLLFVCSLLITISCKKETLTPFTPKNHFKEFQTEKAQIFDLDTLWYKEIIGKYGTRIPFVRELFDVKDGEKIQLELIELYDFKEIFNRQIQTLTTDGKLLETSGVLKVVFTSEGRELKLAKEEYIYIYPPKGKLKGNDIFLSEKDSTGNVTWELTKQNNCDLLLNRGGGISELISLPCDSVSVYLSRIERRKSLKKDVQESNREFFILQKNTSQWINIDRFVDVKSKLSFELQDKEENFSGFNVYINYQDLNSFIYEPRLLENLNFYNIPLSGKTRITVIGENKKGILYDRFELKETMNNSKIELNMKKTNKEELKKLFN